MGAQHDPHHHIRTPTQQATEKCKAINVIISNEAKTLHFVGQMYKSDYFTEEQMTKYKILLDANKAWDKILAHFTELFNLRKAYGEDRAANSGFESAAHVRDHSSACSNITANTKSNLTHDLYIKSLKESLAAAWEQYGTPPRAHPNHRPLIPSHFSKPNSQNNANRYRKS
jgi:hypothetical protein